MIPDELKPFFWDTDTANFDPQEYPDYVIGRILEFGNDKAVAWMQSLFSDELINRVIREDRKLSPRSANYWALIYGIPQSEVAALAMEPARV